MSSVRLDSTAVPAASSSPDQAGDADAFAAAMTQASRPDTPAQAPAHDDHGGWLHRGLGLLQAGVGVMETAGGAAFALATAETGIGAVAGGAVALHGLDDIQAGLRQAWSGKPTETATQTAATGLARHAGASPELAMAIGIGVDIAAGGGLGSGEKAAVKGAEKAVEVAEDLTKAGKDANAAREVVAEAKGAQAARGEGVITATEQGVALTSKLISLQGTSKRVGDFTGIEGATVEEIISRVPGEWALSSQQRGQGIRFLDNTGAERLRLHGPSGRAPAGSNSATGWTLRIHVPGARNSYYDNLGNVVGPRANEGHIPVHGNPNLGS